MTRRQPEGERKTVTALFADIKGSMDMMEDLDPEEARAIVDPALELMMDAAHRYGGHIVQSTGDGVFALFGAPVAHEDHPQRALYAALRMQEEMRRYADSLRAQGRSPLQVRVGVQHRRSRGPLDPDRRARRVHTVGHSTGMAARMQALAPIGSIAVTAATAAAVRGLFRFSSAGAGAGQRRERTDRGLTRSRGSDRCARVWRPRRGAV